MKHNQEVGKQTNFIRTSAIPSEYNIGRSKLQHWILSGFVPVFSPDGPGSRTRFVRRSDLEKFIETGQPVAA